MLVDFDKLCIVIAKQKFTKFHDITNGASIPPR